MREEGQDELRVTDKRRVYIDADGSEQSNARISPPCRDRIGEKDDTDAARTYHEGPPSDPAEKTHRYGGANGRVLRAHA